MFLVKLKAFKMNVFMSNKWQVQNHILSSPFQLCLDSVEPEPQMTPADMAPHDWPLHQPLLSLRLLWLWTLPNDSSLKEQAITNRRKETGQWCQLLSTRPWKCSFGQIGSLFKWSQWIFLPFPMHWMFHSEKRQFRCKYTYNICTQAD